MAAGRPRPGTGRIAAIPTFAEILARWPWRPIPGCPGRYVLAKSQLTQAALCGSETAVERFASSRAKDVVLVTRFSDGGGLISYQHADGVVHTLNTAAGMARKLAALGIDLRS